LQSHGVYYRDMNEISIPAAKLQAGDQIIASLSLPAGTLASVEVHGWTVTVVYTNGIERFTSAISLTTIIPAPIAARA
jgi:hypothetical protein